MNNRFKNKLNIKKGDLVAIISGDYKDTTKPRLVLAVSSLRRKLLVEGVAISTKHIKPNAQDAKGGIEKVETYIDISNVMLWDKKISAPTKIKRQRKQGKSVRISKKTMEVI